MSTFIDIHILQPSPFANPNRDDLNSPKTVTVGGALRSRISSQCLKRNIRLATTDALARSRRHYLGIAERLEQAGWSHDDAIMAGIDLTDGLTAKRGQSGEALLLLADDQIADLTELVINIGPDAYAAAGAWHGKNADYTDSKTTKDTIAAARKQLADVKGKVAVLAKDKDANATRDAIVKRTGLEVAMFGRMLAELPAARVDAALAVAHAFSTHTAVIEQDFFTGVDDLDQFADDTGEGAGSAHMGTNEFTSAVYYRYATVNVTELLGEIPDLDAAAAILTMTVRATIDAFPTAKRTSTAAAAPPALVYLVVRDDLPINLSTAFETPVIDSADGGYLTRSIEMLADTAADYAAMGYSEGIQFAGYASLRSADRFTSAAALGDRMPVGELVTAAVATAIPGK